MHEKNYSLNRKVTNSAVQEVLGAIAYYGADKGIVVTNSFFTSSAKELANVNNITLWDRRRVSQILEVYNQGGK
jgi:restriction system protein